MYLKDKKIKMKTLLYPVLLATTIMAASCTNNQDDVTEVIDPSNKTAISFVGQDNSRLGTRYGFEGSAESYTQIAMHIRSNESGTSSVRETRTLVKAEHDATKTTESVSEIKSLGDSYTRYWDDAFGRKAQLSVFAIAVPGKSSLTNASVDLENKLGKVEGEKAWGDKALSEDVAWTVSADQSGANVIGNEDLTYSNNISSAGEGGVKSYNYTSSAYDTANDGCLKFRLKDGNMQDGPGKFDQGNLKFNHALSRITVNLVKGTGFADGSFNFESDNNVTILNVPTSGKLDIETGTWKDVTTSNITKMYNAATGNSAACSLLAQMLPGYKIIDGDNTNVLEFVIDDNKYFITQDMMYDALPTSAKTGGSPIIMAKGKNYVFTITVNKSKIINVTATLEPWTNVTAADQTIDNAHIALKFYNSTNGTAITTKTFDLYRLNDGSEDINTGASSAKNWGGNYTAENKATLTYNNSNSNSKWETNWFFDDNKSFYHFRSVNKDIEIKESNTDTDDYFVITSGPVANTDPHWGAPFVTSPKYDVNNGYTESLSPAIGATNSAISMTELHMMSNINVVLRTTKTANAVALEDASNNQCVVRLTYFYATGQVKMGNGLVTPTDALTSATFTAPTAGVDDTDATYKKTGVFTYAVVPQALTRSEGTNLYVGITIKTPDNNQYYVVKSLADIIATKNGDSQNQTTNGKIDFWYPNHSYTYTFTLTKAGISSVTCTVEKWVDVTATNKDITLED